MRLGAGSGASSLAYGLALWTAVPIVMIVGAVLDRILRKKGRLYLLPRILWPAFALLVFLFLFIYSRHYNAMVIAH